MVMILTIIKDPPGENYHQTCVNPSGIGHFRITFGLFFKASPGAQPFI